MVNSLSLCILKIKNPQQNAQKHVRIQQGFLCVYEKTRLTGEGSGRLWHSVMLSFAIHWTCCSDKMGTLCKN